MAHKLTSITAPAKYVSPRIFLMCALLSLTPTLGDSCAVINCTTVNTLWTGLTFTKSFAELNAELKVMFQLPCVIESLVTTHIVYTHNCYYILYINFIELEYAYNYSSGRPSIRCGCSTGGYSV